MKYLKYFETNGAITRCTVLIFKKANKGYLNNRYNLERSGEKVFTGKNALEDAKKWCKDEINNDKMDGMRIHRKMKGTEATKNENLLSWWQAPNTNMVGNNYNEIPSTYASILSKYLYGMTAAYMTFGLLYKDQYNLCNIISQKSPKSWESIKKELGENDGQRYQDAADMGNMGFTD